MSDVVLHVGLVVALVLLNGAFAMAEIAVVTARRARLEREARGGDRGARAAVALAERPTQFLSTVQAGITLVGILAGAFGGATIAEEVAPYLAVLPGVGDFASQLAFVLVVGLITYLSLILGELVPKRVALAYPEAIARFVGRPMQAVTRLGRPIVSLLTASTNAVLKVLLVRATRVRDVTEEDIRTLTAQAVAAGVVPAAEQEMLDRVLGLGERPVASVMQPRPDLEWLPVDATEAWVRDLIRRPDAPLWLLVCDGTIDNVIGVVSTRDLLMQLANGAPLDLRAAATPPVFVPESVPLLRVLDLLRQSAAPAAVVLDEYGGVEGLATVMDIVEHLLVGVPGRREAEPELVRREDGTWLVDAAMPADRFEEVVGMPEVPEEERGDYHTVAGLVLAELGRLPRVGDRVEVRGFRFEIVDMDGRRIDRLLVTPPPPPPSSPDSSAPSTPPSASEGRGG